MSAQLETIKCVDWTINFPGAAGGGSRQGESPSVEVEWPAYFGGGGGGGAGGRRG